MTHPVPVPRGLPLEPNDNPFDPPRTVSRLREARPVSPLVFPDGHEGWFVTGFDEVRQLLADTRFSSRQDLGTLHMPYETPGMPSATGPSPQVPGLFIGMDPPEQTRLRRMLVGAFTPRRMRQLDEYVVEITERQLDELAKLQPPVDLVSHFALPVPSMVICEMLGVPYEDRDTFQSSSSTYLRQDASRLERMVAYTTLTMYLTGLVERKRAQPTSDILSDLAHNDELSVEELTGIAFLLLLVGHNSTAHSLALSTFALLKHPAQLAELRTNPGLLPGAVDELMRYISQADIFLRYATEDIELGGELIGAGSTVVISLRAANRDPRRFENPDALDIHREARGHLAFGHGVHQCLGHHLVRSEIRVGLGALLRGFPTLALAVPVEAVSFTRDMNNHAIRELPVTWIGLDGPDRAEGVRPDLTAGRPDVQLDRGGGNRGRLELDLGDETERA